MKNDLLILAVVGMPGTGKSEVIKKLKQDFNFHHLYYGDVTFDEIKRQGLEVNEVNERKVREEFRSSGDMGIYSKFILPKINDAIKSGEKNILLESMYNIHEYEIIKNAYPNNFKVLAIYSNNDLRIKRLQERKDRKLTPAELDSRQIAEAKNLGKGTVISLADYHYINNGNDMKVFENDMHLLFIKTLNLKSNDVKKRLKDHNSWNENKKLIETLKRPLVKVGEIFWCRMGLNIGVEEDGKDINFQRPVIIIKKFSNEIVLAIPMTSKKHEGDWYYHLPRMGIDSYLVLNQARPLDTKRLISSIMQIDQNELLKVKKAYINLVDK